MRINRKHFHTIWLKKDNPSVVQVIDQRKLPFEFLVFDIRNREDAFFAIREMVVRGAPLIGVTAAFGMFLSVLNYRGKNFESFLIETGNYLKSSRPTAVNLAFAVDGFLKAVSGLKGEKAIQAGLKYAEDLKQKEIDFGDQIGNAG
ncbi:MAG: hypothetical protein JW833_02500, partial [Prolixibacteraceae bacterium]|nr:hypothetical protein [Prolixibacteraceae bacterium]